jgi:transcriptional regulator with XRE-family HTH domain
VDVALSEDVGRRIAELRAARGWTQEELAVRLRMTVRRVRRYEAGGNLTLRTLERVAKALAVTPRALLDPPLSRERRGPGRPRKARPYEVASSEVLEIAEPVRKRRAAKTKTGRSGKGRDH